MRLSASRIRSINRRPARAQVLNWPAHITSYRAQSLSSIEAPPPVTRLRISQGRRHIRDMLLPDSGKEYIIQLWPEVAP